MSNAIVMVDTCFVCARRFAVYGRGERYVCCGICDGYCGIVPIRDHKAFANHPAVHHLCPAIQAVYERPEASLVPTNVEKDCMDATIKLVPAATQRRTRRLHKTVSAGAV